MNLENLISSILRHFLLSSVSLTELPNLSNSDWYRYPALAESMTTAEATDMNFLPEAKCIQNSIYKTPDIYTLTLNDICFCPEYNLLHTQSRQIIEESISTQKELGQFNPRAFYGKCVLPIRGICSLFRSHKNGYYHTIIDNLPRLYLLHHPKFRKIKEIKLLCTGNLSSAEAFYLKKLLPENVRVTQVDNSKLYMLKHLIFPSFLSHRFSGHLPSDYRTWFMHQVAPQRPRKQQHRIFISRIATHKGRQRCILNEEALFDAIRPWGFKCYVLEHLPIEEQIALFYDAEIVIAAHGAGLTNTIFSQEIKILELFPTPFLLPHYYFLAKSLGHQYRHWHSHEKGIFDNFEVTISEVLKILESFS